MSQPAFIISGSDAGEFFGFQFISTKKEVLLFFNECLSKSDCIEKMSVAAIHAQYDARFEKTDAFRKYHFVLRSATGKIIGYSPAFLTEAKRDTAITVLQQEIFFAMIEEEGTIRVCPGSCT